MDNQTDYYLVLADLKASTALAPQEASMIMPILKAMLAKQSTIWMDDLVAPLEINYGDEFAGLFKTSAPIYDLIEDIRQALYGLATFRFVVAYGRIGYAGDTVREMGGPVFEVANKTLTALKKRKQFADWRLGVPHIERALSALVNSASSLLTDMTEYQHKVYLLHRNGSAGVEIAKRLDKDPRSVSEAKRAGKVGLVLEIERAVRGLLIAHDHGKGLADREEIKP